MSGQQPVDLVLGTAQLRGTYGAVGRPATRRTDEEAEAFLRRAVELGFSAIDTAPAYDDAEETIGRTVRDVAVHTKLDGKLEPAASVAASLARLHRKRVDVLYFHDPQIALHDPVESVRVAHDLVGGPVVRLGASVYEPTELAAAVDDGRFQIVQAPMSVLDRRIDDTDLRRAADADVQFIARSVFLQGTLLAPSEALPPHLRDLAPYVDAVHDLARRAALSVAVLTLGWVRQRPGIAGVVVGAQTTSELEELASAWDHPPLDPAILDACRQLTLPPARLCDPRQWSR